MVKYLGANRQDLGLPSYDLTISIFSDNFSLGVQWSILLDILKALNYKLVENGKIHRCFFLRMFIFAIATHELRVKYSLPLGSQATYLIYLSGCLFHLNFRECEVFSKNHPAPFSKVITFHKKEPFELEAFYTNLHEVPYPDPRIGKTTKIFLKFLTFNKQHIVR